MAAKSTLILFCFFLFCLFKIGSSTEFLVGGDKGWEVPKEDEDFYNQWAAKNRFKANDTLHFKYQKDSMMAVTEEGYKKCRSSRPYYYSNNGDTKYVLVLPGLHYFISGVAGHCDRGQKMIIKVLEPASPPESGNHTSLPTNHGAQIAFKVAPLVGTVFVVGLVLA